MEHAPSRPPRLYLSVALMWDSSSTVAREEKRIGSHDLAAIENRVGFCSRATHGATRREFEAVQPPRTARSPGSRDSVPPCLRDLQTLFVLPALPFRLVVPKRSSGNTIRKPLAVSFRPHSLVRRPIWAGMEGAASLSTSKASAMLGRACSSGARRRRTTQGPQRAGR
jgi:hypothetical protein